MIDSVAFAQTQKQKTADGKFLTVNALMVGSTIYDIESTYFALGRCETCREANPLMRPFVEAGRPWIYAVESSINVGVIYASYKMKKDKKLWWLLPVAVTAAHSIAGTNNIRIAVRF